MSAHGRFLRLPSNALGAPARRDRATDHFVLRTFARGLLSTLAHDLEITAGDATGEAAAGEEVTTARLSFPVAGLRVAGVVRQGRVDAGVLSEGDRREVDRRIREDVLARGERVSVEAELRGDRVRATVIVPTGRSVVEGRAKVTTGGTARGCSRARWRCR